MASRIPSPKHPDPPASSLLLQRAIGNRAGAHLLRTELTIGRPDDNYEREADRIAEEVLRTPGSADHSLEAESSPASIQRMCAECEEEEKLRRKPLSTQVTPLSPPPPADLGRAIQRQETEEEEEELVQPKAAQTTSSPNSAVPIGVENLQTGGRKLSERERAFYEPRFGYDFGDVRVHNEPRAADMARAVNARALTVGRHIAFGAGEYAAGSREGQRLMAHELTHVIQQAGAGRRARLQRQAGSSPSSPTMGGLTEEMVRQIARRLREAMAGPGTDEEAIYAAFAGRTQDQMNAIEQVYNDLFDRDLYADLADELTESEMRRLAVYGAASAATAAAGALGGTLGAPGLSAAATAALGTMVATQLRDAMSGLGTDESAIFAALTGRTADERLAIKKAYHDLTDRTLEADLRDELSGAELTEALRLLNQGLLNTEDELYLAMAGAGTDEATLFRVLDALAGDSTAIEMMEARYRRKYGDLIADLRSDLSGEEYARALTILGPVLQDVAFEDCSSTIIPEVRSLIPVGIQKVDKAINVLSRGLAGMTAAQRAKFDHFFDPSKTGGIDEVFVQAVLANYRAIRREFDDELTIECETEAGLCEGRRLYYTFWGNIHVCPYFTTKSNNSTRKARDLVHELAHNAMYAVDRPYYSPSANEYQEDGDRVELTPRGPWTANIPVLGPLFRVIARSDTLFHPDAYSWFAFEVP